MSGCPVHIWAPMMAAAVPFSRSARDYVRGKANALLHRTSEAPTAAPERELKHWAPIAPTATPAREDASRG